MAEKDFRVRKGIIVDGTAGNNASLTVSAGNVVVATGTVGLSDGLLLSTDTTTTPNTSKIESQPNHGNIHIEPNGNGDIILVTDTLDTTGEAMTFKVRDDEAAGLDIATADHSYIKLVTSNSSEELNLAGGFGSITTGAAAVATTITQTSSAANANAVNLTIKGGSPPTGGTNNAGTGGDIILSAGQGKGTADGGSIKFNVATPAGSDANTLNNLATVMTISDTPDINFHSTDMLNVDINSGAIDGTTIGASAQSPATVSVFKAKVTGYISRLNALQTSSRFQVDGLDTGGSLFSSSSPAGGSTASYAEARLFSDVSGDDLHTTYNDYSGMSGLLIIDNADDVGSLGQGIALTVGETGGAGDSWAVGRLSGGTSDFTIGYYPKPYEDIGYKHASNAATNDFNPFKAAQSVFKIEKGGDVTLLGNKGDTVNGSSAAHEFNPVSLKFQGVNASGGTQFTGFKLPAQLAASNSIYTFPTAYPGSDKVLQSTSGGVLSWVSAAGTVSALNNQLVNRLVTMGSTTTQLDGEAKATLDGHKMLLGEQSGSGKTTSSDTDPHLHIVRRQDVDKGSGVGDQIKGASIQAFDVADGHDAAHGVSLTALSLQAERDTSVSGVVAGTTSASKALQLSATGSANNYAIYSSAGEAYFQSSVAGAQPNLTLTHAANNTSGPNINFVLNKGAAGATNDVLGQILFKGDDDGQTITTYAAIKADVVSASNTNEEGRLTFQMAQQSDGSLIDVMVLDGGDLADGTHSKVVIKGDLQVDGDTTTVNTAVLEVEDLNITVAKNAADAAAANGAGLTVAGASATLIYASSGDRWNFNKDLSVAGTLSADTSFTLDSTTISTAEIAVLDGISLDGGNTPDGAVTADKVLAVDANKDLNDSSNHLRDVKMRNLTSTGSVTSTQFSSEYGDIKTVQVASGQIAIGASVTVGTIDTTAHRGAEVLTTVYNSTDNTTDLFKTVVMWDGHDTQIQADDKVHYTNYAVLSSGDVASGDISAVRDGTDIDVNFTSSADSADTFIIRAQLILLDI